MWFFLSFFWVWKDDDWSDDDVDGEIAGDDVEDLGDSDPNDDEASLLVLRLRGAS